MGRIARRALLGATHPSLTPRERHLRDACPSPCRGALSERGINRVSCAPISRCVLARSARASRRFRIRDNTMQMKLTTRMRWRSRRSPCWQRARKARRPGGAGRQFVQQLREPDRPEVRSGGKLCWPEGRCHEAVGPAEFSITPVRCPMCPRAVSRRPRGPTRANFDNAAINNAASPIGASLQSAGRKLQEWSVTSNGASHTQEGTQEQLRRRAPVPSRTRAAPAPNTTSKHGRFVRAAHCPVINILLHWFGRPFRRSR